MVDSFVEYLEFEKRYTAHTLGSYRRDLSQFEAFLRPLGRSLPQASTDDIRRWADTLTNAGSAASTLSRKLATLRTYYSYLLREGVVEENPARRVKGPKVARPKPVTAAETSLLELLDHFSFTADFAGQRDRLLLELIYGTGIRLAEVLALTDTDFDADQRLLKVSGKRGRQRLVPVHDRLAAYLNCYASDKAETFRRTAAPELLVTDKGDAAYPMFIYRTVRKYLSQIPDLPQQSPYVLRHSFATHLVRQGADLSAVKDLLGHAHTGVTQVYTPESLERMKQVYRRSHPRA